MLSSEWRTDEGSPRRYYVLSPDGRLLYERLTDSWRNLNNTMDKLLIAGESDER